MRLASTLVTLALLGTALPAVGLGQSPTPDTTAAARRARLRAAMAAARARADSAAKLVERIVVRPAYLDLRVGDSVYTQDFYGQLEVLGVTAAGDTIREFAKLYALEPNPYLEQRRQELFARRPGVATLWIYIGTDMTGRRLFADTTGVAQVQLRVK